MLGEVYEPVSIIITYVVRWCVTLLRNMEHYFNARRPFDTTGIAAVLVRTLLIISNQRPCVGFTAFHIRSELPNEISICRLCFKKVKVFITTASYGCVKYDAVTVLLRHH